MINESIFRAYDVRGLYPEEINEETAYLIGRAYAQRVKPKKVVIGQDLRESSANLKAKVIEALLDEGVEVYDAGKMTNDMISFANFNYGYDGSIILSASHNPIGYGGIKMAKAEAITVPGDDPKIKEAVLKNQFGNKKSGGSIKKIDIMNDYIRYVKEFINIKNLQKKRILFDPLYGSVSLVLDKLLEDLPVERINLHTKADINFGGLSEPNPSNREIRQETEEMAIKEKPDFSVIWDGDGDRCFFLDENAEFVPAPYITSSLVEYILKHKPGAKIVSDVRILWPIEKATEDNGGKFVISKSGYRFIKEKMVETDAEFGAEMTAHYFFKDNKCADNGIIPFLMIWALLSEKNCTLSDLVKSYRQDHFMIDEMKFKVDNAKTVLNKVAKSFREYEQNDLDGITIEAPKFRINLRGSNTEPVIKLNMEAKSQEILSRQEEELLGLIK